MPEPTNLEIMALVQHMIRQHKRINTETKNELSSYLIDISRRLDDADCKVESMQKSIAATNSKFEANSKTTKSSIDGLTKKLNQMQEKTTASEQELKRRLQDLRPPPSTTTPGNYNAHEFTLLVGDSRETRRARTSSTS